MVCSRFACALLCAVLISGCSKSPDDGTSAPPTPEEIAAQTDLTCAEILKASNNMVAESWLKSHPKASLGGNEAGLPVLLSPLVTKLKLAGASRVVVQFSGLERDARILALIVILPADAPSREKLFALEPELSALAQRSSVPDVGQKHLLYAFE